MNEIVWFNSLKSNNLVHYGIPRRSGRYPWGSGKKGYFARKREAKAAKKELDDYIDSDYFAKGDRAGYGTKDAKSIVVKGNDKDIKQWPKDPNWRFYDRKKTPEKDNKEPEKEKNKEPEKEKKNKKEYKDPTINKNMDQKTATEALKADTEYRKAVKENVEAQTKTPTSVEFQKAANNARQVSTSMGAVSQGVDKAWNSLHNAKYGNEDRSKYVRGLTNEELRRTIERIELDQRYNRVTMPPKSKGYDRTMAALAVLGSVATVTATGLSIAATVQSLKKR